jgi:ABC-type nitrate/sulfonate/bicarbonate transport system substrate-binding protein
LFFTFVRTLAGHGAPADPRNQIDPDIAKSRLCPVATLGRPGRGVIYKARPQRRASRPSSFSSAGATPFGGDTLAASLSGTTPIRARIEGADTVIMMGLLNSFTLSVICVPEIKKTGDLKGRFIGVGALGGSPTLLTQRLLKKWGLETDVKFLATGGYVESVAALEKRRVHAAVLDPPRAYIARKKFGFKELANLGQEFKYATTVIVARESQLRKDRETFIQFAKAVIEGTHRVKTNREFAIKTLSQMLRSQIENSRRNLPGVFGALRKGSYPAVERIQPILDEIALQNPKAKNYKPDDFINTTVVKQLNKPDSWKVSTANRRETLQFFPKISKDTR